jgi:hypothetical protein
MEKDLWKSVGVRVIRVQGFSAMAKGAQLESRRDKIIVGKSMKKK